MKFPITISIEKSTIDHVDNTRGQVPRSRVLEDLIDRGRKSQELQENAH
jgi:hypothetical protein